MNDLASYLDAILTHLTSDVIWKMIEVIGAFMAGSWATRFPAKSLRSRIIQISVAMLFLGISIWLALLTHPRSGFFNGAWFATWCGASVFLTLATIYLFTKKFLPIGLKRRDWLDHTRWELESSSGGKAQLVPSERKMLSFVARFNNTGVNWSQMMLWFDEIENFRGYAGITFRIEPDEVYPDCFVQFQVRTSKGVAYRSEFPPLVRRDFVFLFQELVIADWSAPNPSGCLDLSDIKAVIIAVNTPYNKVGVRVGRFRLIDYPNLNTLLKGQ